MKRNSLLFVYLILTGGIFNACAKGSESEVISKDIKIESFEKINVSSAIKVIYNQEAFTGTAKVEIRENLLPYLVVNNDGNCLDIYFKEIPRKYRNEKDYTIITVSSPVLTDIEITGASIFTSSQIIQSSPIDIEISGASQFSCDNLEVVNCKAEITGASSFQTTNFKCGSTLKADISGASSFIASFIENKETNIDVSGAGNAKIGRFKGGDLNLEVSGASSIKVDKVNASDVLAHSYGASNITLSGHCSQLIADKDVSSAIETNGLKY